LANKSILIIGPYPPPPGGVSIHVQRLEKLLIKEGFYVDIANVNKHYHSNYNKNIFHIDRLRKLIFLDYSNYDIVHIHYMSPESTFLIFLLTLFKKNKLIISFHNERIFGEILKYKILFKIISIKIHKVIIARDDIRNKLLFMNIFHPEKVVTILPFIKPTKGKKADSNYKSFGDKEIFFQKHNPVIFIYAHRLDYFNGKEMYGLAFITDFIDYISKDHPNIGLYLKTPYPNNKFKRYIEKLMKNNNLEGSVYWSCESDNIINIISKCDIYIRPTETDGDSVLLREALYLGVKCIASDVINRPEGCLIYSNRNIQDLEQVFNNCLNNPSVNTYNHQNDSSLKLIEVYNN